MLRVFFLALVQSLLLASAQVFLKIALAKMLPFAWTRAFWASVLLNWQFAVTGLLFGGSSLLWLFIIKRFPFSVAYPLVSLSYVFGMLAAIFVFHEEVSSSKWIGVGLIMLGCFFVAR